MICERLLTDFDLISNHETREAHEDTLEFYHRALCTLVVKYNQVKILFLATKAL